MVKSGLVALYVVRNMPSLATFPMMAGYIWMHVSQPPFSLYSVASLPHIG